MLRSDFGCGRNWKVRECCVEEVGFELHPGTKLTQRQSKAKVTRHELHWGSVRTGPTGVQRSAWGPWSGDVWLGPQSPGSACRALVSE